MLHQLSSISQDSQISSERHCRTLLHHSVLKRHGLTQYTHTWQSSMLPPLSPKLTNSPLALCRLHTFHFFSGQISMHCFFSKFKLGFSLSSALLNFWRPHIITDLLEPSLSHIQFRHLKYLYVKRAV